MVIKLYISGISGNKEVKKKQQRVQMILDSKQISYEAIDITEPGKEKEKEFMQQNGKVRESLGKHPLPPQIFNEDDFCGDYEDFDMANEIDELEKFLHIATNSYENETKPSEEEPKSKTNHLKQERISKNFKYNPYDYHTYKLKWDRVNGIQEIINTDNMADGNTCADEISKSEVNGETEAVLPSEISGVLVGDNQMTDDISSSKENELSLEEKGTVEEGLEEKVLEENIEENQTSPFENEGEKKEEEKEEEKEREGNTVSDDNTAGATLPQKEVQESSEKETPPFEAQDEQLEENVDNENQEKKEKKADEENEGCHSLQDEGTQEV